ncbi:hypothetical protein HFP57_00335 [Parasphingopyxis algicola]|uniref:hypothetical protein n=1 Tax=Parasphingopyxis algicola TaxID=2026624 RepID=UPI0015A3B9F4|nr:hypothetical protein [Parasphingopyxis algicola]QLC23626.1 hypothetical protein HFP57_00335 [Parasphingopyxis algicola]
MGTMVIVAYRPKSGQADALETLVRDHVPRLRALDLVTDRAAQAMRARDGTIVEIFEWKDGAIDAAHEHPDVQAMWAEFAEACDYAPLETLDEASRMFAEFEPLDL